MLRAIRESEALAAQRREAKGKRRSNSMLAAATADETDEDDPEVRRVMQLSLQEEQAQSTLQQEEWDERQRRPSTSARPSSAASTSYQVAESARGRDPSFVTAAEDQDEEEAILLQGGDAPPAYEPSGRSDSAAGSEKGLVWYPPVATNEMAEGTMRVFVPHMLFALRNRRDAEADMPIASRDVDLKTLDGQRRRTQSSISQAGATSGDSMPPRRTRRPLPPIPSGAGEDPVTSLPASTTRSVPPMPKRPVPQPPPHITALADPASQRSSPYHFPRTVSPSVLSQTTASPNLSHGDSSTNRAAEDVHSQIEASPSEHQDSHDQEMDPFDDPHLVAEALDEFPATREDDEDFYYEDRQQASRASGYDYAPEIHSAVASPSDWRSAVAGSASDESGQTRSRRRSSVQVGRHDYARRKLSNAETLPPAMSPEIRAAQNDEDDNGSDTDQGAISWESTASEDEGEGQTNTQLIQQITDVQDINTNISFGFNPLSSPAPRKPLEWHGRFPDLITLYDPQQGSVTGEGGGDYRTFCIESHTWRELLAYVMWHGNAMITGSVGDQAPTHGSLKVSLILEFVKTLRPPSTLVRLQIHLLGDIAKRSATGAAPPGSEVSGVAASRMRQDQEVEASTRGVALSRKPLSDRPTNYVQSTLPWQQAQTQASSTHLVLAFPKPYLSLPFTLGTIGTHLHSSHKTALALASPHTPDSKSPASPARQPPSVMRNQVFLADLLKGIEMCSGEDAAAKSPSTGAARGAAPTDDSLIDRFRSRLRSQRHSFRGTLKDLHRSSRRRGKKGKGKGKNGGAQKDGNDSDDSGQSHLESQPQDVDYHVTPYPFNA